MFSCKSEKSILCWQFSVDSIIHIMHRFNQSKSHIRNYHFLKIFPQNVIYLYIQKNIIVPKNKQFIQLMFTRPMLSMTRYSTQVTGSEINKVTVRPTHIKYLIKESTKKVQWKWNQSPMYVHDQINWKQVEKVL
jgi:hypothetical protein